MDLVLCHSNPVLRATFLISLMGTLKHRICQRTGGRFEVRSDVRKAPRPRLHQVRHEGCNGSSRVQLWTCEVWDAHEPCEWRCQRGRQTVQGDGETPVGAVKQKVGKTPKEWGKLGHQQPHWRDTGVRAKCSPLAVEATSPPGERQSKNGKCETSIPFQPQTETHYKHSESLTHDSGQASLAAVLAATPIRKPTRSTQQTKEEKRNLGGAGTAGLGGVTLGKSDWSR